MALARIRCVLHTALCLVVVCRCAAGQTRFWRDDTADCFAKASNLTERSSFPANSIVIGALLPASSYVGNEVTAAVRLAVWQVNNNSNLLEDSSTSRQLCILAADSKADPFSGFQGALRLAGEHLVGVVGPLWASVGDIVAPLANKAQLPFLSPAAFTTAFHVTQGAGIGSSDIPYLRRVCCNNTRNAELLIDIIRAYKWNRIGVFVSDNDYGHSSSQQLSSMARQHSIIIPKTISVSPKLDTDSPTPSIVASDLTVLTELKVRIFVCMVMDNQIKDVLLAANESGLIGPDFVWLFGNTGAEPPELLNRLSADVRPLTKGAVFTYLTSSASPSKSLLQDWQQVAGEWYPAARNATTVNTYALLAYDTIQLLAEAIHDVLIEAGGLNTNFSYGQEPMVNNLLQLPVLNNGSALLNRLQNITSDGFSGALRIDEGGDVKRSTAYTVYNVLNRSSVVSVGTWDRTSSTPSSTGWKATTDILWNNGSNIPPLDQDQSARQTLRILVPQDDEPYIFYDGNKTGTKAYSGFAIDLLKHLSSEIGFSYEFELWNETWDRMVETVGRPDTIYDMAIGDITVTSYRELVCDFTSSFFQSSYRILVKRPSSSSASGLWQFFDPFSWDVWIMLLAFLFFSSFMLWFLEHWHLRHVSPGLAETMWVSFSTFYSTQKAEKITSNYGRFYLIVACFIVMVINAAFTANMTSFLLDKDVTLPYSTLPEVGSLGVGVQGGTATYRYIKNVEHVPNVVETKYDDAVKHLNDGTIAVFINNEPSQKYLALNDCGVALSGNSFHQEKYAFALKRGSPLLSKFNQAILNAWDSGYIEDLYYRRFVWNDPCKSSSSETEALRLSNVGGLFIMVLVAAVVCLIGHFAMKKIEASERYKGIFDFKVCMDTEPPLGPKSESSENS